MQQFLGLSCQGRNRKENDGSHDRDQRKHQQDHTGEARNVAFLQPDDDRIKNHGEQKHEREEQNHGLKRTQNQPDDDQQKNEPDDPPGAVITQRSMLIFVIGLVHKTRWFGKGSGNVDLRAGSSG